MEFHEVVSIWPRMQSDEFAKLVEDIKANGLREDIWIYQNKIIDGRHRYLACQQAQVAPRYREWDGAGSLVMFVASLNQHRRHLDAGQKAMVALEIERQLSVEAKEHQRLAAIETNEKLERTNTLFQSFEKASLEPIHAAKQAAKVTGSNTQYVVDAKRIVAQAPELREAVMNRTVSLPEAKKLANHDAPTRTAVLEKVVNRQARNVKEAEKLVRQEVRRDAFEQAEVTLEHCAVYPCAVASLHSHVEANSLDAIITDPPYPKEYLSVYTDLAQFAAYALKPGGSLLVMIGQSYLPEILQLITAHVPYHWTVSYQTPGGQAVQLWQKKVNTFWKPVLWFVKGQYTGEWVGDVTGSKVNDNDKNYHHWGQSESGIADIIERFTFPGQLVCDPFVGGGTTAVVAAQLKRRFIGCDVDESCVQTTLARAREALA